MSQIVDDVVYGSRRSPARRLPKLAVVADENRNVGRTLERGVAGNVGGYAKPFQDAIGQVTHRHSLTATHVVDLATRTLLEKQHIRGHDVRNVKIVANDRAIADPERAAGFRKLPHTPDERRKQIAVIVADARVIEASGTHDVHSGAPEDLQRDELLRRLGHGIWREWPQRGR